MANSRSPFRLANDPDFLEAVRREMIAPNNLQIVESGDHSLFVRKRQLQAAAETQEEIDRRILDRISGFVNFLFGCR